jgi:transposase
MAWTETTRPRYQREALRYASDTTDAEWTAIEPHLPPPAQCGRTRETALRDVVDAIFYIAQSGCQWRMLPKDFPPYWPVRLRGTENRHKAIQKSHAEVGFLSGLRRPFITRCLIGDPA